MRRYVPTSIIVTFFILGPGGLAAGGVPTAQPDEDPPPPSLDDNPYDDSEDETPPPPREPPPDEHEAPPPTEEPAPGAPTGLDEEEQEARRVERLDEVAEHVAPSVHVVVWIGAATEELVGYRFFSDAVVEAGFSLVLETVESTPTAAEALEIMLSHRAVAVVWHDASNALQVFFREVGRPEMITTESGDPKEEALYLKELLLTRTGQDSLLSSYLVTVPEEVVEAERPRRPPASVRTPEGPPAVKKIVLPPPPPKPPISRKGWKIGLGYALRAHSDTTLWWQSALRLHVPIMRASDLVELGVSVTAGFPTEIGEDGVQWLEIRSFDGVATVGVVPLRMDKLEVAGWFSLGVMSYSTVAFLSTGETESGSHLTGVSSVSMGAIWYPFDVLGIRLYFEGAYVFAPPSYSINGNGKFGEYPWIPGGGLDIIVSLSRT